MATPQCSKTGQKIKNELRDKTKHAKFVCADLLWSSKWIERLDIKSTIDR